MIHPGIVHGSPAWKAMRLRHFGSSESGALFGQQSDFLPSLYTLHMIKAGKIAEPDVSEELRVRCGTAFEGVSLALAASLYRWRLMGACYATDDACPGLGASVDERIEYATPEILRGLKAVSGPGVVEHKWIDWLQWKKTWVNGEPPFSPLLQLQHGLAATGYEWGVVVCCIGGNDFKSYPYQRRPELIDRIRERVADFWARVRDGREPDVDGSASTAATLKLLYPAAVDYAPLDLEHDADADEIAQAFLASQADATAAADIHGKWKNKLRALLGKNEALHTANYRVRRQANNAIKVSERVEKYA